MLQRKTIQRSIYMALRPMAIMARRLLSAPFENLPPAFGETVELHLRAFESQAQKIQHEPVGQVSSHQSHGHTRSRAAKRGSYLERE